MYGGKKRRSMLRLYIFREAQNIAPLQRRATARLYIFRFQFSIFRFKKALGM